MFDAIYTRQSVDRIDSISVESQVEFCNREVVEGETRVYTDRGYSGKNIDRPAFQEMMADIEAGHIRRVIVYRLDRISRSVLDFASVIDVFQKHSVDFVSTMEKFDTGTPIGKAMLMIVMIFAQLERETIQQRVVDAYQSRSKRGFYMGGKVPYGFRLHDTVIDGVRTKMYEPVPEEVDVLQTIFAMYSQPQTSFGDVARFLDEHGIRKRDGKPFSRSRIRDVIVNPVYVLADYRLYEFYKAQGTKIVNSPEDFIGTNGAYLYSGNNLKRKTVSLEGHSLVLAPHRGFISSSTWIKCRNKCLHNSCVAKPVKAKATWLAGKIKCGHCGYSLSAKIYHCKTKKDNRYYICNNKYNTGCCDFGSLDADMVDQLVFDEMKKKLEKFKTLSKRVQDVDDIQTVKLRTRINEISTEIDSLMEKIPLANGSVMEYINDRVSKLDTEKKALYTEVVRLSNTKSSSLDEITDYMSRWDQITISDKISVVDSLITSIYASKEKIQINWKI